MFYDKGIRQLQEMDMVEFVAFMSLGELAPVTIITYMSGVKYHLWLHGINDFNDSFILRMTLKGVASSPHNLDVTLPITLPVLEKMLHALPLVNDNQFEVCMLCSSTNIGFSWLTLPGRVSHVRACNSY